MRVFILCAGRTGSTSFIHACEHIENYTVGHETRSQIIGERKFHYPENHIEADNRLSWQLGKLDEEFGDEPLYVHLKRDRDKVSKSFQKRYFAPKSIIDAYTEGICMNPPQTLSEEERLQACFDYYDTVEANIKSFLASKENTMTIHLEKIRTQFPRFWKRIGAKGNLEEAISEFSKPRNVSRPKKFLGAYRLKLVLMKEWERLKMIMNR